MSDPVISQPLSSQIFTQRTAVVQTPSPQAVTQLTASAATIYTAPNPSNTPINGITRAILYSILVSNTDASARTVTGYIVPSGGSAATGNTIIPTVSFPANSTTIVDFGPKGIPLVQASTLQLKASVTLVVNVVPTIDEVN